MCDLASSSGGGGGVSDEAGAPLWMALEPASSVAVLVVTPPTAPAAKTRDKRIEIMSIEWFSFVVVKLVQP
jgi:hypothetical protein